jgi:hypothetical protein
MERTRATVMQDEFENTYDYLGDGSSNYVPNPSR